MFRFLTYFVGGLLGILLFKGVSVLIPEKPDPSILAAKRSSQNEIVLFTGSDWSPSCILLEEEILKTPKWKDFVDNDVRFRVVDVPQRGVDVSQLNLIKHYEIRGFPTMLLLSPAGEEITRKMGFGTGGADEFISWERTHRK